MSNDWLAGLGIVALIIVCLFIIFIPIIVSVGIATALAAYMGVSGFLWWCIVIFVTLVLWGILGKLFD